MPQITHAGVSSEAPVSFIEEMSEGIQRDLGRIEGKLDSVLERLSRQDIKEESQDRRMGGQDRRIGNLERWRSGLAGAYAAAILIIGALWGIMHGK